MKLYKTLVAQLKKENDFVTDNGDLKKWIVLGKAWDHDIKLIELLLDDETLKEAFFIAVKDALVFKHNKFIRFLEQKNYFNDSYTRYKNKVGLHIEGKYLNQRNEVALVWPFKDCILEGGQSNEEQKREEIFFNQTLAQDEITQLLEPKVLTAAVTYSKDGAQDCKGFHRDAELNQKRGLAKNTITDNLIIKGNNLLALHSLKKQFAGKVKLIYIDPPYNTGNDGFKYNDNFNHSTWLTFMQNRLQVARILLKDDGVIFVQCDDNEQAYLKVLMDEIFGKNSFVSNSAIVINRGGKDYGGIAKTHEYILIYGRGYSQELNFIEERDKKFRYKDEISGFNLMELRNRNILFNDKNRPNLFYPFYVNPNNKDENGLLEISLENKKGFIEVLPLKSQNIQTVWRWGKEKALKNLNKEIIGKEKQRGGYMIVQKYRKTSSRQRSVWDEKSFVNERGTEHIKELFGGKAFAYPKAEFLLSRIIELGSGESDIVLDYHLGSGTTAAVAHKMGRQYIGIEQMDYIETIAVERLQKVIAGEQGGISKAIKWQGGNGFTYLELKKHNQTFIEKIAEAKDSKALLKIWAQMKAKSFLNYNVDLQKQQAHLKEFKALSLQQQQRHLCELLDKNQLYVNLSSLQDQDLACSEAEKQLSADFYQLKK